MKRIILLLLLVHILCDRLRYFIMYIYEKSPINNVIYGYLPHIVFTLSVLLVINLPIYFVCKNKSENYRESIKKHVLISILIAVVFTIIFVLIEKSIQVKYILFIYSGIVFTYVPVMLIYKFQVFDFKYQKIVFWSFSSLLTIFNIIFQYFVCIKLS